MSRYASLSMSDEKSAYRILPSCSSRHESNLCPPLCVHLHVPYRQTRRLVTLLALLACNAFACFVIAYWLFTTRDGQHTESDDITTLDEPNTHLDALRIDTTTAYLAYLPHSGLHNQRIALENALTLARILNRTLLIPPARLGPKTLRYVRSNTLVRMLQLSNKRHGRVHCAYIPVDVPTPDECVDYETYTLVPWAWLVDLEPIKSRVVRVSNGSAAWIQERLGIRPDETLFLPDSEPYEYQFVDTLAPVREGVKYLHTISIETLVDAPQRLIQLGTLFGSSRLRLRKADNRRVRSDVRRHMVLVNPALKLAAERIGEVLGGTYVGVHVRVGDGRFQKNARANVKRVWWTLVRDVLGMDLQTALELERGVSDEDGDPPDVPLDVASLRTPHPPLPPLSDAFSPKRSCRHQVHTLPRLRRLNVPLFIATDALDGLDDPLLAPLVQTFPCTFTLASFETEMGHLKGLRNVYDGVGLAGYVVPMVDGLVMGGGWSVVGTDGSTFSRYVVDVLWRVSHGWDIVERG